MSAESTREQTARPAGTVEERQLAERRAWGRSGLLIALLFAIAPVVGVVFLLSLHQSSAGQPLKRETVSIGDVIEPVRDAVESFSRMDSNPASTLSESDQEQSFVELRRISVLLDIGEVDRTVSDHRVAQDEWSQLSSETLANDAGRRIAADDNALRRFVVLRHLADLELQTDSSAELSQLVNQAQAAASPQEFDRVAQAARRISKNISSSAQTLKSYSHTLESLVQSVEGGQPATTLLADMLAARKQELQATQQSVTETASQEFNEAINAERKQFEEQRDSLLTKIQSLKRQLDRVESRSGGPDPQQAPNGSTVVVSRESYRQSLPQINTLLTPFISSGYAQPGSRDQFVYRQTKNPMSYSALVDAGALEESQQGLETLFRMGGLKSANQHNDRPLGGFPRMNETSEFAKPEVAIRVRDAQRLLRQYGPLMLKDGLLSQ